MKSFKHKIVYIQWRDAQAFAGWQTHHKYDTSLIESVGFLVKEDDSKIILAVCVSEDESNAVIAIPKAWVTKRKTIQY